MTTGIEVFLRVKEMSGRNFGPRPRIALGEIAASLSVSPDALLVLLKELQNRGLVVIHTGKIPTVSLSSYGVREDEATGGFGSE